MLDSALRRYWTVLCLARCFCGLCTLSAWLLWYRCAFDIAGFGSSGSLGRLGVGVTARSRPFHASPVRVFWSGAALVSISLSLLRLVILIPSNSGNLVSSGPHDLGVGISWRLGAEFGCGLELGPHSFGALGFVALAVMGPCFTRHSRDGGVRALLASS